MNVDVIVIGAGAAGLMCAASAAKRGRKVIVLDHANKPGKKILMSGGGRCNFTNLDIRPENYLSQNPHFCKSALSRYTQWDFIALVDEHGIPYHEKTQGQLFCDNKASDILNMLLEECHRANAAIHTSCAITQIQKDEHFQLETSLGHFSCDSLVIASGGLSIPTMGATGFGYQLAQQFGLHCLKTDAALVPFTLSDKNQHLAKSLSGLSLKVNATSKTKNFIDDLLFTHRGLSGPVILQLSNYWQLGESIEINLLPTQDIPTLADNWKQEKTKKELTSLLSHHLPKRFIQQYLSELCGFDLTKTISSYSAESIEQLSKHIHHWSITPSGTEGYRTAEVTSGGVNTDEISSKTFEAKKVPGLYFIGEVLDVTGWLGGFNFQWAWSSGWCAGQYV
ncbi:hypothetical protein SAMN02745866_01658 [Alteromonadaceae bacterium Bs31]|nr:hypothetical protein SAMN02745866_01658 [Alteromonadaceae bacterium Bs31]